MAEGRVHGLTLDEWLAWGVRAGFVMEGEVGRPFCVVHDGPPLTVDEVAAVEAADGDRDVLCVAAVRLAG